MQISTEPPKIQTEHPRIIFVDDDDMVYDCYVSELLKASDSDADCFAINGIYTINNSSPIRWKISKDYTDVDSRENGEIVLLRRTNHITGVKREIAIKNGFPRKSNAEDKAYTQGLVLNTEALIEPPMYHYKYSSNAKEYT